jgi:hypothetical protein
MAGSPPRRLAGSKLPRTFWLRTAQHNKQHPTFSGLLQTVRIELWRYRFVSEKRVESKKNPY